MAGNPRFVFKLQPYKPLKTTAMKEKYCRIRKDILFKGLSVPVGTTVRNSFCLNKGKNYTYRWTGKGKSIFQIYYKGHWRTAQSIDFDFGIQVLNVLKCIDIDAKAVNLATWNYCNNFHVTYRDNVLREHLININSALEEIDEYQPKMKKVILKDLKELNKLAGTQDAAYVRFVEH